MSQYLRAGVLIALIGAVSVPTASQGADQEAIRRQQEQRRQQQIQQERANLDNQIRSGQRKLEQARQQEQQFRKALPGLQKQYQGALQQVEQFKPQVQSQQQEVDSARTQQKAASDRLREARKRLNDVGDRLEKSQPGNAPIVDAKTSYEKAHQKYEELLKTILESAEYKEAFQAALDSGDREKAGNVRSHFVKGNVELSGLQLELKTRREAYEELRKKMVEEDSEYQQAAEAVKSAQGEVVAAGDQLDGAVKKHGQARAAMSAKVSVARKIAAQGNQAQSSAQRLENAQKQISQEIKRLQDRRNNLR